MMVDVTTQMTDSMLKTNAKVKPYFSILVASMGGACLYEALRSINSSDDQDFEVVLVIDNPEITKNDLQYEQIDSELKAKLFVIFNQENIGVTKSLNRGLSECSGQIICRLDDDDCFLPKRLSLVRAAAEQFSDIDVFTGGALVQDDHGSRYRLSVPIEHQDIANALARRNVLVHSGLNVRRRVFDDVAIYDEQYYFAQDYALYLRWIREGVKFKGIDQPIVTRSEGVNSITVHKRRNQALYSFSALALHHARLWGSEQSSPMLVVHAFIRFMAPQFLRQIARRFRGIRRVNRL